MVTAKTWQDRLFFFHKARRKISIASLPACPMPRTESSRQHQPSWGTKLQAVSILKCSCIFCVFLSYFIMSSPSHFFCQVVRPNLAQFSNTNNWTDFACSSRKGASASNWSNELEFNVCKELVPLLSFHWNKICCYLSTVSVGASCDRRSCRLEGALSTARWSPCRKGIWGDSLLHALNLACNCTKTACNNH